MFPGSIVKLRRRVASSSYVVIIDKYKYFGGAEGMSVYDTIRTGPESKDEDKTYLILNFEYVFYQRSKSVNS